MVGSCYLHSVASVLGMGCIEGSAGLKRVYSGAGRINIFVPISLETSLLRGNIWVNAVADGFCQEKRCKI